jgi:hypothetical protein
VRLKAVAVAAAFAVAMLLAPQRAAAQEGPWFFCYVDPPIFGRGTYLYTRVNYIGSAAIPQNAIAAAMAADDPQVAGRDITCWRYATQAEAEDRRRTGMAGDKSHNYAIREIGWTSPYSPPAPDPLTPAPAPMLTTGGAGLTPGMSAKPADVEACKAGDRSKCAKPQE